jgi:hypothetical protein
MNRKEGWSVWRPFANVFSVSGWYGWTPPPPPHGTPVCGVRVSPGNTHHTQQSATNGVLLNINLCLLQQAMCIYDARN